MEIIFEFSQWLDVTSLHRFLQTCHRFNALIKEDRMWNYLLSTFSSHHKVLLCHEESYLNYLQAMTRITPFIGMEKVITLHECYLLASLYYARTGDGYQVVTYYSHTIQTPDKALGIKANTDYLINFVSYDTIIRCLDRYSVIDFKHTKRSIFPFIESYTRKIIREGNLPLFKEWCMLIRKKQLSMGDYSILIYTHNMDRCVEWMEVYTKAFPSFVGESIYNIGAVGVMTPDEDIILQPYQHETRKRELTNPWYLYGACGEGNINNLRFMADLHKNRELNPGRFRNVEILLAALELGIVKLPTEDAILPLLVKSFLQLELDGISSLPSNYSSVITQAYREACCYTLKYFEFKKLDRLLELKEMYDPSIKQHLVSLTQCWDDEVFTLKYISSA